MNCITEMQVKPLRFIAVWRTPEKIFLDATDSGLSMSDDSNGPDGFDPTLPTSLLPYDTWLETAQREVMLKALDHVSEHGLPGEHHFYMTFLTNVSGVDIPSRLKERYPEEMTIVLQHQFQNLTVNRTTRTISVGLSFGGIPCTLSIPFRAVTAFADPYIHLVLRFTPPSEDEEEDISNSSSTPAEVHSFPSTAGEATPPAEEAAQQSTPQQGAEVVSLAAFRKKPSEDSPSSPDGKDH